VSDAETTAEGRSLNRRQLIKRAGAVGVTAWVAPIIIDSLASPAAATTLATDCYSIQYGVTGTCATQMRTNAPCCNPNRTSPATLFAGLADFTTNAACISVTTPSPANCAPTTSPRTVAFTMSDTCNCVFVAGAVQRGCVSETDIPCVTGVLSGSPVGKIITFTNSTTQFYFGAFRLVINCGGSTQCAVTVTSCAGFCEG
jgi:hypothetical protein